MAALPGELLDLESLDPVLSGVIRDNREKVAGWLQNQPGCWGFLAGKAVAACRQRAGRPLGEAERRLVWHRLWWWLEQIKNHAVQSEVPGPAGSQRDQAP